jgi:pimeloyl-ACP methyl ester carboxylesterase
MPFGLKALHGSPSLCNIWGRAQKRGGKELNESGYLPVGKLHMYYEIHGEGTPLLLLHGGGSGIHSTFGRILPDLARTHQVIGIEQQGHGHTADIDRPFALEQMADDTAEMLTKLGVASAHVFGFSNGGHVALHLALRHPQKIQKLVLASTFFRKTGVIPELQEAWTKQVKVEDMPVGLRDEYRRIAPKPEDLQRHIDKSQQMMRGFKDVPASDLKHVTMPTLVMNGDRDVVLLEHAVEMMRLLPEARLIVLPGAHGAYIGEMSTPPVETELPNITVSLVNEFLAGFQV